MRWHLDSDGGRRTAWVTASPNHLRIRNANFAGGSDDPPFRVHHSSSCVPGRSVYGSRVTPRPPRSVLYLSAVVLTGAVAGSILAANSADWDLATVGLLLAFAVASEQ